MTTPTIRLTIKPAPVIRGTVRGVGLPGPAGPAGESDWDSIANKPLVFPPSAHSHPVSDLTGLGTGVAAALALDTSGTGGFARTASPTFTGSMIAGNIVSVAATGDNIRVTGGGGNAWAFTGEADRVSIIDRATNQRVAWRFNASGAWFFAGSSHNFRDATSSNYAPLLASSLEANGGGSSITNITNNRTRYIAPSSAYGAGTYLFDVSNAGATSLVVANTFGNGAGTQGAFPVTLRVDGPVFQSGVGAVGSGDRYTIYATDTTFNRSVGLYHSEDGTEGGLKATSQIRMRPGGKFLVQPSGQTTIFTEQSIIAGEYVQTTAASSFVINNTSTAVVPLRVRGVTSQTANLFECQTVTPTTVFSIDSNGAIVSSGTNSIRATFTRNSTQNSTVSFVTTATTAYVGVGATNTFAASLNPDLVSTPPFQVNLSTGALATTGNVSSPFIAVNFGGAFIFTSGNTNLAANSGGGLLIRNGSNVTQVSTDASGNLVCAGTIGFSQSRIQQSAAQTLQTQCFDTSLSAWQETTRSQASAVGAKWSVFGATPIVQQTLPAAATDPATTQTLCNAIRSLLLNFGFSN